MIVKSAEFVTGAVKAGQYPAGDFPEIAFAGRSNVGKSSLINTLVNRKRLVKTSGTPGRTQQINFFIINETVFFVDLPGYGYARVPAAVRKNWGPMIENYLKDRRTLKALVLIMDIRRVPGPEEANFMAWLHHFGIPRILVLTKTDKLSKARQTRQRQEAARALAVDTDDLILFSAKSRKGKADLWQAIDRFISNEEGIQFDAPG